MHVNSCLKMLSRYLPMLSHSTWRQMISVRSMKGFERRWLDTQPRSWMKAVGRSSNTICPTLCVPYAWSEIMVMRNWKDKSFKWEPYANVSIATCRCAQDVLIHTLKMRGSGAIEFWVINRCWWMASARWGKRKGRSTQMANWQGRYMLAERLGHLPEVKFGNLTQNLSTWSCLGSFIRNKLICLWGLAQREEWGLENLWLRCRAEWALIFWKELANSLQQVRSSQSIQ